MFEDSARIRCMWNNKSVSLVMPTYREKDSIRAKIEDFLATGLVDEVIVANNNAETGTDEEIRKIKSDKIKIIYEKRQGYGYALQAALLAASGDLVVSIEPDATYIGKDLKRFLIFSEDFPVVFGSRVIKKTHNKDWGYWRREVNFLYGTLIHLLFNTNTITDIGCTYKLLKREVIHELAPHWRHGSSLFATELLLLVITRGYPFIEIPVTFEERVGGSVVIGSRLKLVKLAFEGLWQIIAGWIRWLIHGKNLEYV
ncbi:MAG: Glycosyl transferase, family 2 [Candidatus Kaiserbacteria bacterium GW2011_GWB1_52_6]|uniref:Glycosyl transferase, family 2 n=2 Tax=Candidatus Kaiseribacteriota TaxID=1752734 RepID=A0A0G1ZRD7_9BACT|nr:MAG: Glycosyl transferase, family 2 [Candidatus Kaiserbacteria bacterium GW2011_GWB1_52_6]KKW30812.1 MAG: Glycosyl transferase, family 2 [Candidatus Kaiserbacteria bacterium GW2011_GWC2_52_8b]